jgi:CubicO group peptidase (beta-lactamase class C family)
MSVRFLPGAALALLASMAAADAAPPADLPGKMDALIQAHVADQKFMGTVLVARGDTVVFSKAYGSANLEWNVPNSRTTKFRIGSITKQFTAAAILMLEERGKLHLDDPIGKYYAQAPAAWSKVTLADLLRHTSGIHSYTDDPEFDTFTKLPATPESLIGRILTKPLDFEAGSRFHYSNTGYILLGMVIERASGMKYADFLRTQILDPLGMKDSGHDLNAAVLPQRATGYVRDGARFDNAPYLDMTVPYAAGALYSSADDLLRWQRGLFGGKLLSEASLKKMLTPGHLGDQDYGFGIAILKKQDRTEIRHGGSVPGFNASLAYVPESDSVVIALSNVNGRGAGEITDQLIALSHERH